MRAQRTTVLPRRGEVQQKKRINTHEAILELELHAHSPVPNLAVRRLPVLEKQNGFAELLGQRGHEIPARRRVTTLQVNVGKLCNMACQHCHVDAGPKRTEIMRPRIAERVIAIVAENPAVEIVDITGGAPELNPSFRYLVSRARELGRTVIDRCNLTVLLEPGMEEMPEFLATHQVQVVASLPCYQADNVDKQRGRGAFEQSIEAIRRLNALGYGRSDSELELDFVYNPVGAFLPPEQSSLEAKYKAELFERFRIEFNRLLTITNMPISRFAHFLERTGQRERYEQLLIANFNPTTLCGLMCRSLVSIAWDGRLFDCDFNQMLDLELGASPDTGAWTVWDIASLDDFVGQRIATARHCFGCTAGSGSSCGGALQ